MNIMQSRQFLGRKICTEIIEPRLKNNYIEKEAECMIEAASLCISTHPEQRPRMSEVLKVLEGDMSSPMPNPNPEPASIFPRHSSNDYSYTMDRSSDERLGKSLFINESTHNMKFNPSTKDDEHKKENKLESTFKQARISSVNNMGSAGTTNMNHFKMLGYDEYQEYLQGSLSRYIQNLKVR